MKLYKLTNAEFTTRNRMRWGENVTNTADEIQPPALCTSGVLHAYPSALLAVFMAPVHVDADVRTLWEAEGDVVVSDGTKVGCRQLTTLRQISLPKVTTEQRVKFAVLCALQVYVDAKFTEWANNWLSGKDRSANAADAASADAANAADAASADAAYAAGATSAARAANAASADAAYAAYAAGATSAARAANAADAAYAAYAAGATSAARAARAARAATSAAEWAGKKLIDFAALAEQAMS